MINLAADGTYTAATTFQPPSNSPTHEILYDVDSNTTREAWVFRDNGSPTNVTFYMPSGDSVTDPTHYAASTYTGTTTFTGYTTIEPASSENGSAAAPGSGPFGGAVPLVIVGGKLEAATNGLTLYNPVTFGGPGGGLITVGGTSSVNALNLSGTLSNNSLGGNIIVSVNDTLTLANGIGDGGNGYSLTLTGGGTMVINGSSSSAARPALTAGRRSSWATPWPCSTLLQYRRRRHIELQRPNARLPRRADRRGGPAVVLPHGHLADDRRAQHHARLERQYP